MVFLKKPLLNIIVTFSMLIPAPGWANPADSTAVQHEANSPHSELAVPMSETDKKDEERKEFIKHHLLDSHDFHLFSYGEGEHQTHVGFPLPVILVDEGLHIFSSSKFNHGHSV